MVPFKALALSLVVSRLRLTNMPYPEDEQHPIPADVSPGTDIAERVQQALLPPQLPGPEGNYTPEREIDVTGGPLGVSNRTPSAPLVQPEGQSRSLYDRVQLAIQPMVESGIAQAVKSLGSWLTTMNPETGMNPISALGHTLSAAEAGRRGDLDFTQRVLSAQASRKNQQQTMELHKVQAMGVILDSMGKAAELVTSPEHADAFAPAFSAAWKAAGVNIPPEKISETLQDRGKMDSYLQLYPELETLARNNPRQFRQLMKNPAALEKMADDYAASQGQLGPTGRKKVLEQQALQGKPYTPEDIATLFPGVPPDVSSRISGLSRDKQEKVLEFLQKQHEVNLRHQENMTQRQKEAEERNFWKGIMVSMAQQREGDKLAPKGTYLNKDTGSVEHPMFLSETKEKNLIHLAQGSPGEKVLGAANLMNAHVGKAIELVRSGESKDSNKFINTLKSQWERFTNDPNTVGMLDFLGSATPFATSAVYASQSAGMRGGVRAAIMLHPTGITAGDNDATKLTKLHLLTSLMKDALQAQSLPTQKEDRMLRDLEGIAKERKVTIPGVKPATGGKGTPYQVPQGYSVQIR